LKALEIEKGRGKREEVKGKNEKLLHWHTGGSLAVGEWASYRVDVKS
jgi:hypothetical protein